MDDFCRWEFDVDEIASRVQKRLVHTVLLIRWKGPGPDSGKDLQLPESSKCCRKTSTELCKDGDLCVRVSVCANGGHVVDSGYDPQGEGGMTLPQCLSDMSGQDPVGGIAGLDALRTGYQTVSWSVSSIARRQRRCQREALLTFDE
jgi:hypothetical protein